jgi:hypothetical protein
VIQLILPATLWYQLYKKYGGQVTLAAGQFFFHDLLSSCWSMIENIIGIWKGRFPFLRNIRVNISLKSDMQFLIKLVKVAAVLHNLLVDHHTIPKTCISLEDLIDQNCCWMI